MPQLEIMPSEWFAVWHEVLFKFGDLRSSLKVKHKPHKLFPEPLLNMSRVQAEPWGGGGL